MRIPPKGMEVGSGTVMASAKAVRKAWSESPSRIMSRLSWTTVSFKSFTSKYCDTRILVTKIFSIQVMKLSSRFAAAYESLWALSIIMKIYLHCGYFLVHILRWLFWEQQCVFTQGIGNYDVLADLSISVQVGGITSVSLRVYREPTFRVMLVSFLVIPQRVLCASSL